MFAAAQECSRHLFTHTVQCIHNISQTYTLSVQRHNRWLCSHVWTIPSLTVTVRALPGRLSQTNTDNLWQWRQSSVEWCVRHGTYLTWPDNYHEIKWQSPSPGYTEKTECSFNQMWHGRHPLQPYDRRQSSCAIFNYNSWAYSNILFFI